LLDGANSQSRFFANLAEVKAALDTVFIAGDYNGDGLINSADYNYWRSTLGQINSLAADGSNNGQIDAADYVTWRKHAAGFGVGTGTSVPEPASTVIAIVAACLALSFRVPRSVRQPATPLGGDRIYHRKKL
jgi:hypothetical protein